MPIRILHVVHGLRRGGLENGVVNLLNHLAPGEFEQGVACLDQRGEMAERVGDAVPVWVLSRKRHDLSIPWRLSRIVAGWKPHVVHCRNWNTWLDAVFAHRLARKQGRLVWSFHGFPEGDHLPVRRRLASRALARLSDHLFAVCGDSADRYAARSGIPRERFAVIYNGVNTERFSPAVDRRAVRMELDLPTDAVMAVTVASLTPVKDHAGLIEAVRMCRDGPKRLLFVFVGSGPLRRELEQRIEDLGLTGCVMLAGHSDRVADYMKAADLFILPSRLEGMSNVILEAMATGLPVIVRRVGGNPELVMDEETGLLAAPDDVADLAAAIARLASDEVLRTAMGRAGRERAERIFSLGAMMAAYGDFYRRITSVP